MAVRKPKRSAVQSETPERTKKRLTEEDLADIALLEETDREYRLGLSVPIDAEIGRFFCQTPAFQFGKRRFNVVHLKKTAFLCRVPSVFAESDLNTIPA